MDFKEETIPNDVRTASLADRIDKFLEGIPNYRLTLLDAREDHSIEASQLNLKQVSQRLSYIRFVLLQILMLLCLFTKPPWCTKLKDRIDVRKITYWIE